MARGWESKSVAEQQSEFGNPPRKPLAGASEKERQQACERQRLQLARASVANQLKLAQHQRYIDLLTSELKELDRRLAALRPS